MLNTLMGKRLNTVEIQIIELRCNIIRWFELRARKEIQK